MTHSTLSDDRPAPPLAGLRTGFIGLGNMGGRMARRLVEAGRPVLGYDARPESIEAAGATAAPSVAEVVAASDVVLLSLPESRIVEAVVLGEDGILAHARPGQVLVDLSTSAPASTIGLHGKLKDKGMTLIDAGISGGAAAAEKGTLTLMVGGDPAVLERVRPVLDVFSEQHLPLRTAWEPATPPSC